MMTSFIIITVLLLFFIFVYYIFSGEKIIPITHYPPPPSKIMVDAEPFFWEGNSNTAFLILHGFTGSPFEVKPIGEFLHQQGHTVWGILFPGHGTHVKDMVHTRFYHYLAIADDFFKKLVSNYNKVYIIGNSMGGTIALRLAQIHNRIQQLKGIIAISAPIFFNGFFSGKLILHSPYLLFTGILKNFIDIVSLNRENSSNDSRKDFVGYKFQYPLKALHSFKKYLPVVRKNLNQIKIPVGLIMNELDKTVPIESLYYIQQNINSIYKKTLIFRFYEKNRTGHVIIQNLHLQKYVLKFIMDFINEVN